MTQPQQPDTFTFEEALAAVAAAQTALAATDAVAATVLGLSSAVIAAREAAAAYAKAMIWALWSGIDPYDGNAVQDFTVSAAARMVAAQTATARTAAAAQSAILGTMGIVVPGSASNPTDVRAPGADVINGALVLRRPDSVRVEYDTRKDVTIRAEDMTTEGIFNRPARTLRAVEAEGATRAEADGQARDRIEQLVEDNVMLAQRFAEAEVLQRAVDLDVPGPRIIGYRRVIHPELSRTGVCGLCIAAADQRYKVGTLLPIHGRCKCTVAAITEEHDPADDVNAADLGALYDLAGGTDGRRLKRVRFQEDEHGELGAVVVPAKKYKPRVKAGRGRPASAPVAARSRARVADRELARVGGGGGGGGGGEPPRPPGGDGSMDDWDDDRIPPHIRRHILDGDARGGGHRHDSTTPRKTLFPAAWSDAKCMAAVSAALDDPYMTSDDDDALRSDVFLNHYAIVDGVRVAARILKADGTLDTAYPLDGEGVFRTGKKDGTVKKALPLGSVRGVPLPP